MSQARKQQLKFHVEAGDYFATLATVLNLIQDSYADALMVRDSHTLSLKTLQALKKELLFLQKHYQIVKRPNKH